MKDPVSKDDEDDERRIMNMTWRRVENQHLTVSVLLELILYFERIPTISTFLYLLNRTAFAKVR